MAVVFHKKEIGKSASLYIGGKDPKQKISSIRQIRVPFIPTETVLN
jgi:hypothetical protein